MSCRKVVPCGLCLVVMAIWATAACAEITVEKSPAGAVVKIDGQLFTEYVKDFGPKSVSYPVAEKAFGTKPILWPLIGPTGKPMTRFYPMEKDHEGERQDHPWHGSFWFTHGDVNGFDFWGYETIKHREFVKLESGPQGVIVTRNDWISPDGVKQCEDERTLTFGTDGDSRWIDFDVTVKATDKPAKFGDTKEGSFGVRVPGTMKVDAKLGGQIINSEGQTDKDAWGKRAAWVDYHGPVDGETLGIAIFNHPSSFRFPTYWHVRTYGLFAANPFGLHNFLNSKDEDGSLTLAPGESFTLRYRVLLHKGDEKDAHVAEAFRKYAELAK